VPIIAARQYLLEEGVADFCTAQGAAKARGHFLRRNRIEMFLRRNRACFHGILGRACHHRSRMQQGHVTFRKKIAVLRTLANPV
jgi:hypothetical protein